MSNRLSHLKFLLVFSAAAAAAVLLVSVAGAAKSVSSTTSVGVSIGDGTVNFTVKSVPAGTVKFVVKNVGTKAHAITIGGKTTPTIKPGASATLIVVIAKAASVSFHLIGGRTGTLPVTGGSAAGGNAALGKPLFKSSGCGACHVLKAAGTTGSAGPNLDTHKYTLTAIVHQITNGGRFMPPFSTAQGGKLSSSQIQNVAAFVYASTH